MKACAKEKCLCCEILPQTAEHASRKKFPHVRAELRSRGGGGRGGVEGGLLEEVSLKQLVSGWVRANHKGLVQVVLKDTIQDR